MKIKSIRLSALMFAVLAFSEVSAQKVAGELPQPGSISIDKSLPAAVVKAEKEAAINFYAFWNTGKQIYLDKSVSKWFKDNMLPAGRPQGVKGLSFASQKMRAAVPDIRCEIKDLLITADKVTARLLFTGNFKGEFMGIKGNGRKISFYAIDILHIKNGKIIEDWHIEDNLVFFKMMGVKTL